MASVLAFRWRTHAPVLKEDEEEQPAPLWKRGTAQFLATDTMDDLRTRLAVARGSSAELAAEHDPQLWLCDEHENPTTRLHAPDALEWTLTTCPRTLFNRHASGRRQAVVLFTFPPVDAAPTPQAFVWRVNAVIEDAKRRRGVRGAVFVLGSECHALYLPEGRPASIFHVGVHLHIALLFEQKSDAMSFQTALQKYALNNPLLGLSSALRIERTIHQQALAPDTKLESVFLQDYMTADSDSPPWSLAAYAQSDSSLGTPATVTPDRLHQCLERPGTFSGLKLYRLHLRSQSEFPRLKSEENNLLFGTWTFHQYLDGLNTLSGLPGLAIRSDRVTRDGAVEGRARVDVLIELRGQDEAAVVPWLLKEGSEKIHDLLYRSFVYVTEPALFVECLTWKYEDTRQKWATVDTALADGVDSDDSVEGALSGDESMED